MTTLEKKVTPQQAVGMVLIIFGVAALFSLLLEMKDRKLFDFFHVFVPILCLGWGFDMLGEEERHQNA